MRNHWLITLGCCALVSTAHADDSVFDFVGTRADQEGMYNINTGAIMSGGLGTLAPVSGWFDESWEYRFGLTVDNPNASALTEWPIALDIDAVDAAGYDIFQLARGNGSDIRVVQAGAPLATVAFGHWDLAENRGRLWFQLANVASGQTGLALYFGNDSATIVDDPDAVFTYSTAYASRYALEPDGIDMIVASSADGNQFTAGNLSGTLAAGEVGTVISGEWSSGAGIASTAPMEVAFNVDTGSEGAPVAFARTLHSVVVNRGTDNTFTMLAPHDDATVAVTVDGSLVDTLGLTQGTVDVYVRDLAGDAVIEFAASSPILVAHRSTVSNNDGFVLPPPAPEVWGFRSGTPRILAVSGDAEVTVYDSLGASSTLTINQGQFGTLVAGGSGDADALRLMARDPATGDPVDITVVGTADGDGGDAIVFHPASELGRRWVVPTDSTFVLIAVTRPSTTCVMTPADGSPDVVVTSSSSITPPNPGRIMFGAATGVNVLAGSVIECDSHGFAYHEDQATDDERNLYPAEAHRKSAEQPVSVTFGASLTTRYLAGTVAIIDTPDLVVPSAVEQWTDFRVASSEPEGSRITYQVSIDRGQTWLIPNGVNWIEAPNPELGLDALAIRDGLSYLDSAAGRLRVRVLMFSEDGISRPSIDAIRVFYSAGNPASHLGWDDLGDTAFESGLSFPASVSVLNPDGLTITGYNGTAELTASHGGPVSPTTVSFENGRASFFVAVGGIADDVTLRAVTPEGLAGFSAPFDLVAADGYSIEAVSGADQFGYVDTQLAEPIVVRVLAPGGSAAGQVQVTFAINEGDGALFPDGMQSAAVLTGTDGLAEIRLRLGADEGINSVRVEAAGAMLELFARGDLPGTEIPTSEGGCCGASTDTPTSGTLLLLLAVGLFLRRRTSLVVTSNRGLAR